ncbi:HAUS augmin-like complex subunit 4 [Mortierella alpina]|nr:HAUS augmin-like complex subunit 4 [Mortierella alpina]
MEDPDILKRHPRLNHLITDLNSRFLTPTGSSLQTNQDLHEARYNLKHKKEYLETKAIFESIERLRFLPLDNHHHPTVAKDALEANRTADLQKQVSDHIDRILSILDARRLVVAEALAPSSLDSTHTSKTGSSSTDTATVSMVELLAGHDSSKDLDGFTLEHLQTHLEALEGFSQPMYKTIEEAISARALDIATLHSNTTQQHMAPAEALERVVSDTRKKVIALDKIRDGALLHELEIQQEVKLLFDTLQRTILVLWEVVHEFRIRYQFEQYTTFQEYFSSLSESIILKLKILKVTLQDSVYDHEAVQKLSALRDTLESKERQLQVQTTQNATLLQQYQSAGPEFNMIVDAYADLMQRIDIVEDDIRRLE